MIYTGLNENTFLVAGEHTLTGCYRQKPSIMTSFVTQRHKDRGGVRDYDVLGGRRDLLMVFVGWRVRLVTEKAMLVATTQSNNRQAKGVDDWFCITTHRIVSHLLPLDRSLLFVDHGSRKQIIPIRQAHPREQG